MAEKLGEMLLRANIISHEQLARALNEQHLNHEKLGFNLVKLGFAREEDITSMLSKQFGVPGKDLKHYHFKPDVIKLLPLSFVMTHKVIPLERTLDTLTVAMAEPTNLLAIGEMEFTTGCTVDVVVISEYAFREALGILCELLLSDGENSC